jgi:flagellar biosynthesis anti-sigma factor FlgM
MKIDPSVSTSDIGLSPGGNSKTAASANQAPTAGEDTATLAFDHSKIGALTAEAMAAPDVRQDKIDALREAINSGQYKIQPDEVAEAMLQEAPEL